jgi:hypothetical protein
MASPASAEQKKKAQTMITRLEKCLAATIAAAPVFSLFLIAGLLYAGTAVANDDCQKSTNSSGDTVYTCEGDQSAGVQNGHNNLDTNADDVIV